jgi:hypothetical protein
VAVDVTFFIGDVALNFAPDDSSVSQAKTYCIGNLGIPTNTPAGGGLPHCRTDGFLEITNGMNLMIPGTDYGHRRQKIIFYVGGSGSFLNVLDINLCNFMQINQNNVIQLDSDYPFVIAGSGGTALVMIGQIFLA